MCDDFPTIRQIISFSLRISGTGCIPNAVIQKINTSHGVTLSVFGAGMGRSERGQIKILKVIATDFITGTN